MLQDLDEAFDDKGTIGSLVKRCCLSLTAYQQVLNHNPQPENAANATTTTTTVAAQLQQLQQVGNVAQNSSQQTQSIVGTPGAQVNSQTGVSQQARAQVQQLFGAIL